MWDEPEVSGAAGARGSAAGAGPEERTTNGLRHGTREEFPGPRRRPFVRSPDRTATGPPPGRGGTGRLTQSSRASASTGFGIMKDVAKAAARMTTPATMAAV